MLLKDRIFIVKKSSIDTLKSISMHIGMEQTDQKILPMFLSFLTKKEILFKEKLIYLEGIQVIFSALTLKF